MSARPMTDPVSKEVNSNHAHACTDMRIFTHMCIHMCRVMTARRVYAGSEKSHLTVGRVN